MKITFIVHQFFPEYSTGTEVLTYQTALELRNRGHDVEVLAAFPADPLTARETPFASYEYEGLPVFRFNHNDRVFPMGGNVMEYSYYNLVYANFFRDHVKRSKPDVVHAFHLMRSSVSPIDICLDSGIPMVFAPTDFWIICPLYQLRLYNNEICSGPDPNCANCIRHLIAQASILPGWVKMLMGTIPKWFLSILSQASGKPWWPEKRYSSALYHLTVRKDFIMERINRLDRVITPARFLENMLVQNGLDRELCTFIPFGLNLKPFENTKPRTRAGETVFGYIGTLLEHKGTHVLIEAARRLPKDAAFKIKIYGNPNEKPAYTERLKALAGGDSRIEFCGTFPNDHIGEVLSGLDALVVPSIWYENTPLVILSAHAQKMPVIGTNLGGISEVVHHEKNGLLFEKGNSGELSELMMRFIDDTSLRDRLAAHITPPQSIPEYVDKVEQVYREVLEKRKSR